MTHPRLWVAFIISLLALAAPPPACASEPAAPAAAEPAQPAPQEPCRMWVEPVEQHMSPRIGIRAHLAENDPDAGPLTVTCTVKAQDAIASVILRLEIADSEGAMVCQKENHFSLGEKQAECAFELDAAPLPCGEYDMRLKLFRPPAIPEADRAFVLRKLSWGQLTSGLEEIERTLDDVAEAIKKGEEAGKPSPYLRVRTVIAQECVTLARAAINDGDWNRIDTFMGYLRRTSDSLRAQVTLGARAPELAAAVPEVPLTHLENRNGSLYAGARPVFLMGRRFDEIPGQKELADLKKFGLNYAAFRADPQPGKGEVSVATREQIASALGTAANENISVTLAANPDLLCSLLAEPPEEAAGLTEEQSRQLLKDYLVAVGGIGGASANGLCLLENPAFKFTGEHVRQGFLEAIKRRYKDRHEVNRAWNSLFADLDEVAIGWDEVNPRYQSKTAYRFDWQTFHQRLGTEFVQRMADWVRMGGAGLPVFVSFSEDVFERGESRFGVDREALAPTFDLLACSAANRVTDPFYAMGYPQQSLNYTLLRSLAPGKPLLNIRDGVLTEKGTDLPPSFGYIQSALWEAVMAGLSGSAVVIDSLFLYPDCIEAYATTCLDLNRLADVVAAFQQAPCEVGILWSPSSKIYGDGDPYLESVAFAFEGCSFAGHKTRFISEQQCADGELSPLRVLVIPDTPCIGNAAFDKLIDYIRAGHTVVRTTTPIVYDERGQSRRDTIVPTQRTVFVHGENLPTEYLHAMDAVMNFGELSEVPRTVNQNGYPLEGVISRSVSVGNDVYLYILSVRTAPVPCSITGGFPGGRDILGGDDVEFPMTLEPLRPMIVRLNPPGAEPAADLEAAVG